MQRYLKSYLASSIAITLHFLHGGWNISSNGTLMINIAGGDNGPHTLVSQPELHAAVFNKELRAELAGSKNKKPAN